MVPDKEEKPAQDFNAVRAQMLLQQLSVILDKSGFVSPELLDELRSQLAGGPNSLLLNKLLDQLDRFDYPAARTTLIGLAEKLGIDVKG